MKFITLLTAAYVGGVLRHPHEGAISVADDEAERLVASEAAEDVTDGFSAAQVKAATGEPIEAPAGPTPTAPATNPHQAEVPPATKPHARKAATEKE